MAKRLQLRSNFQWHYEMKIIRKEKNDKEVPVEKTVFQSLYPDSCNVKEALSVREHAQATKEVHLYTTHAMKCPCSGQP